MPTLTELYEESNYKRYRVWVSIAGHLLAPLPDDMSRTFAMGQVGSLSFTLRNPIPAYLTEDSSVIVWEGFDQESIEVFNGFVESISVTDTGINVECTSQGYRLVRDFKAQVQRGQAASSDPRYVALATWLNEPTYIYPDSRLNGLGFPTQYAEDMYEVFHGNVAPNDTPENFEALGFANTTNYWQAWLQHHGIYVAAVSAQELIASLLHLAGVPSYHVDVGPWTPGLAGYPTSIDFSNHGDAINKLAEPFASPWYEMPNGQIRVELRDQVPAPGEYRKYFAGITEDDGTVNLPAVITNPNAKARIRKIDSIMLRREVYNKVTVNGASLPTIGPEGEQNTTLLTSTAYAQSPWIPPINGEDQYNELVIQNELLDVAGDVADVALRYLILENRLIQELHVTIDGDPQVALGMTVQIADPQNTGIVARYVIIGYTTSVSDGDFVTELTLRGGRAAGTTPHQTPFALFTWRNQYSQIPPQIDRQEDNGTNKSPAGSKLKQYVPQEVLDEEGDPGVPGQRVIVTYDATSSFDPDGRIISYEWEDDYGHLKAESSNPRWTTLYNPEDAGTIEVTLTVRDNEGNQASETERVNINSFSAQDGYEGTGDDGGGEIRQVFVAVVGAGIAGVSPDGGQTWNMYAGFNGNCIATSSYGDGGLILFLGSGVGVVTQDGGETWLAVQGPPIVPLEAGPGGDSFACISADGRAFTITTEALLAGEEWTEFDLEGETVAGESEEAEPHAPTGSLSWIYTFTYEIGPDGTYTGASTWTAEPVWEPTSYPDAMPKPTKVTKTPGGFTFDRPPISQPACAEGTVIDVLNEPGNDGVFIFATASTIYKSLDGGAHCGPIFINSEHGGGTIRRISTSQIQLMAPGSDLLNLDDVEKD